MSKVQSAANFPFRDNPDLSETYVDGVYTVAINGKIAHVTLSVNRAEKGPPGADNLCYKVPAARLVIEANCIVDLHAKLTQVLKLMSEQKPVESGVSQHHQTVQ